MNVKIIYIKITKFREVPPHHLYKFFNNIGLLFGIYL